jgi:hypothetical protein
MSHPFLEDSAQIARRTLRQLFHPAGVTNCNSIQNCLSRFELVMELLPHRNQAGIQRIAVDR